MFSVTSLIILFGLCIPVPGGTPQYLSGSSMSSTNIILAWDPPLPEEQNGIIIGYVIDIAGLETGERLQFFTGSSNLSIAGLSEFTTYVCVVAANTSIGRGPFSAELQVKTLPDGKNFCLMCVVLF